MTKLPAVILGTGPSLEKQRDNLLRWRAENKVRLFGVNNTFNDFPLDVWIACDPKWHEHYGQVEGDFDKWHWDKGICEKYGYQHIEGRWGDGLSTDKSYIHYGHSSGYQALGLAAHYGHKEVYLAGFDMEDAGKRHYFDDLSDDSGEYPEKLRKYSKFAGLIECYETVWEQTDRPVIFNMNPFSALRCFPFRYSIE